MKTHKIVFWWFYTNFGVPYLSILVISINITAVALLLLQGNYTQEIVTCLNHKCWYGSSLNMQNNICIKNKFANTDIYSSNTLVTFQ